METVIFDGRPETQYGLIGLFWAPEVVGSDLGGDHTGQSNGLLAAAAPGKLCWSLASCSGGGRVRIAVHDAPPEPDADCPDVVESSIIVPPGVEAAVLGFESADEVAGFQPGTWRVRLSGWNADEADQDDALLEDRTPVDEYHLDLWPQAWGDDRVVRLTSDWAQYWHKVHLANATRGRFGLRTALAPAIERSEDALVMRRHGLWSEREVVLWARGRGTQSGLDATTSRLAGLSDAELHLVDQLLGPLATPAFERSHGRSRDDLRMPGVDQRLVVLAAKACVQHGADPVRTLPLLTTTVHFDLDAHDPPSIAVDLGRLLDKSKEHPEGIGATGAGRRAALLDVARRGLVEWDVPDPEALVVLDRLRDSPGGTGGSGALPGWKVVQAFCEQAAGAKQVLALGEEMPALEPVWRAAGLTVITHPIRHGPADGRPDPFRIDLPDRSVAALDCGNCLAGLDDEAAARVFSELRRVLRRGGVALVEDGIPVCERDIFPNLTGRSRRMDHLAHSVGLQVRITDRGEGDGTTDPFWMVLESPRSSPVASAFDTVAGWLG